jgi:hypothetical protein
VPTPTAPADGFDQDTILTLAKAYDRALAALDSVEDGARIAAAAARHRLARQIVQMGREGERDPDRLRLGILTEIRQARN